MNERERKLTDEVVAGFAGTTDPRLREIMQSLVRHLHGFAREVRLSQREWQTAIEFLTRAGHLTDDRRQEFVLLSDVLGLSALTVAINAPNAPGATEATVLGPFFVEAAPEIPLGGDLAAGSRGTPCHVSGHLRSTDGSPLAGARLDVWGADADGFYDVQHLGGDLAGRGWLRTGADGAYRFWTVLPTSYPIPHDGPVGDLLAACGRSPMRPAHLHFKAAAPGHRTLITHLFDAADPHLGHDAVFGVRDSLITEVEHHTGGIAPDGAHRDGPWAAVTFDLVLVPDDGS
ncbi:dioxygenase [Nonomuraea soli]|uniref:Hydroxyquinol 1,2-dioxygenase n=1 Tax=Nonomuraea soli TaxID=1032476 RepID=A0A7W0CUQ4_9ACTN|nr:dioxygenase [Nonomuraea soli]MBA2897709.1 hydroxyquinol 1,2-dioxygenase [Nonomuraea soli]